MVEEEDQSEFAVLRCMLVRKEEVQLLGQEKIYPKQNANWLRVGVRE